MKAIALISGGIDSPVAAYLMAKKGVEIVPLHLDNRPFSGRDTLDRALVGIKKLQELSPLVKGTIVMKHGPDLEAYAKECEIKHLCVFCKRMMFRIASRYGESVGASFLITGDSLAQVASQTLQNIIASEDASSLPIVRPLVGLDKLEIERIAKEIGTFDISIRPAICCTMVPKRPSTATQVKKITEEENKLDIDALVEAALESAQSPED